MIEVVTREDEDEDGNKNENPNDYVINGKYASGPNDWMALRGDNSGRWLLSASDREVVTELMGHTWEELPTPLQRIFVSGCFSWLDAPHYVAFNVIDGGDEPFHQNRVSLWIEPAYEAWGSIERYADYCTELGSLAAVLEGVDCTLQYKERGLILNIGVLLTEENGLMQQPGQAIASFLTPFDQMIKPLHEAAMNVLANTETDEQGEAASAIDESYLRLYVPDNRYNAEQIEPFVRLWEGYMGKVEGKDVQVDVQRTGSGTLYIFRSDAEEAASAQEDFPEAVDRFERFMALCNDAPDTASDFVKTLGVPDAEASALVAKYGIRYNRLQMDTRHEREAFELKIQSAFDQKRLAIQHQFEAEASEFSSSWSRVFSGIAKVSVGRTLLPLSYEEHRESGIAVSGSGYSAILQGVVNEVLGGKGNLSPEDIELLRIIRENAKNPAEATSLESDFSVATDETARMPLRREAWGNVRKFLNDNKGTLAEAAFKVCVDYGTRLFGS